MKNQPTENEMEIVVKSVSPKPTKAEIIEALFRVKKAELLDEIKKNEEKREKLSQEATQKLRAFVKKNIRKMDIRCRLGSEYNGKFNYVEAEIHFPSIPEEVLPSLKAFHACSRISLVQDSEIKREIRESMGGCSGDRVSSLISNPQTKKALQAILVQIGMSDPLILALPAKA